MKKIDFLHPKITEDFGSDPHPHPEKNFWSNKRWVAELQLY
jgi:hypothetical protein